MFFFNFFLGLLLGVSMLVNAAPFHEDVNSEWEPLNLTSAREIGPRGYDPSYEWHADHGAVQVWMGKNRVYIGNRGGFDLYNTVWKLLDWMCPSDTKFNECHSKSETFGAWCMVADSQGLGYPKQCTIRIYNIYMHWESERVRKLLIGLAAGTLLAATEQDGVGSHNCHHVTDHGRGCNVGNAIRINLPDQQNHGSGWERNNKITFWMSNNQDGWGDYNCCTELTNIGHHTESFKDEILESFPRYKLKPWGKESRCIINGWEKCPGPCGTGC